MAIEVTMRESLRNMPPKEFINILHPVFEQEEIKLIIVGGVLGCAGERQASSVSKCEYLEAGTLCRWHSEHA